MMKTPTSVRLLGLAFLLPALMGAKSIESSCAGLIQSLREMKSAQQTILLDLSQRHDTFASTLDSFAESFQGSLLQSQGVSLNSIEAMNKSSADFREAGQRSRKMTDRFHQMSSQLFDQIEICLKSPQPKSKSAQ